MSFQFHQRARLGGVPHACLATINRGRVRGAPNAVCVAAHLRYLGGYRTLMGGGAFYDTVTVYVAAPE